jgi:hypothetical protein
MLGRSEKDSTQVQTVKPKQAGLVVRLHRFCHAAMTLAVVLGR